MPTELKMPALSPTMEEGTLAKWLVKEGDTVKSGDLLAEIETDKATMEFEAVDEGTISKILVAEGTDGVKVGAPIAILAGEGRMLPLRRPCACAEERRNAAEGRSSRSPRLQPRAAAKLLPRHPSLLPRQSPRPHAPRATASRPRPLGPPACRSAGHRSCRVEGLRPRWPHRPRRPWRGGGRSDGRAARSGGPGRAPAGGSRTRLHRWRPARVGQAVEYAQDDRAAPDRVEATDPAYLSDPRLPARCAAQIARRIERGAGEPRRQTQRQRSADQGARSGADRSARMQRQLRRRHVDQISPRRHFGRGVDPRRADHADRGRARNPSRSPRSARK